MQITKLRYELASYMLESRAVKFGDFTLKSGRKSPYFFNVGQLINTSYGLNLVARVFAHKIVLMIEYGIEIDFLFGIADKGTPLAAATVMVMRDFGYNLSWGYNRKVEKTYADSSERLIIGDLERASKLVFIDDVITTAGTKLAIWSMLKPLVSVNSSNVLVLVDREEMLPGDRKLMDDNRLALYSVYTIRELVSFWQEDGLIDKEKAELIYGHIKQYGYDWKGEESKFSPNFSGV